MALLIGFDKNRKTVEFRGHSKLSLNLLSKYLNVEPENEEFKLISATFNWHYVIKKNLLFVFAEHNFMDFCLSFKNEEICKKIMAYIISQKTATNVTNETTIETSFLIPIFQTVSINPRINYDLVEVIAKWHQCLDHDDKEKYTQLMKDYQIYDFICNDVQYHDVSLQAILKNGASRKRKVAAIKKETDITDEAPTMFTKFVPSSQFQVSKISGIWHRKLFIYTSSNLAEFHEFQSKKSNKEFKCVKCDKKAIIDVDENGEVCAKVESKTHSCKPSSEIPAHCRKIEFLRKPAYEIIGSYLIVFDPIDRNLCYEYCLYSNQRQCLGCRTEKKSLDVSIGRASLHNEGTPKEHLEVLNEHICKKRTFQPQKYWVPVKPRFRLQAPLCYDYVLEPNFEIQKFIKYGNEHQRLIIFDQNDRSKCYRYFYTLNDEKFRCYECLKKGKYVNARMRQNFEKVNYVVLSSAKHECEPKLYVSKIILRPPQIQLIEKTKNGKPKLFVFEKNDRKKCRVFKLKSELFTCIGCYSKTSKNIMIEGKKITGTVSGRLLKDENAGTYSFEMKPNQVHICDARNYQSELSQIQIHPKMYDFFYYRKKNRLQTLNVAIQDRQNPKFCYTFNYVKSTKLLYCIKCNANKSNRVHISAKFGKDEDGKEYFEHDAKKHVCQPVKISSISPPGFVRLQEGGIKLDAKLPKQIEIDESKVVNAPNFEIRPGRSGIPDMKLIILDPFDKTLCFEYNYMTKEKKFKCGKCHKLKSNTTATVHINQSSQLNEEKFVVMGENEHICQPSKYVPYNKIVKKPNFKLCSNKDGVPDKKLIIFHSTDRALCYELHFTTSSNFYQCAKCMEKNVYVRGKLQKDGKNDETYVLMGKNEHICEPIKYQEQLKIVRMPNFELRSNNFGVPDSKLIILHSNDKKLCYDYYYIKASENFKCRKCENLKVSVTAKIHKADESNDEAYVVMGNTEHLCKPSKYIHQKL